MKRNFFIPILFVLIIIFFAYPLVLHGRVPIPADTIVGLYHPFRDFYAKEYPNGIPYQNFLITDPVRQLYPWRWLAIGFERQMQIPLWNPYSFAGTPLLANFQTAAFYPLNLLLFIFPFWLGWSVMVLLQPFLAGLFLYCYLRHLRLSTVSSMLGGIVFAFCGYTTAWLEWNTIAQTALWLPLILLSIDKIFSNSTSQAVRPKSIWGLLFVFSLTFSFLAGHTQPFFYLLLLTVPYFFVRWFQRGKTKKLLLYFFFLMLVFVLLTSIQWIPTLQFIVQSARNADQLNSWQQAGWFIPWQHLIQFVAPDFFGNPATLNYWGTWNYGELVGYVGIGPLIFAIYAMFFRKDKKTLFFGIIFFLSLIFALPTIFAKLPFIWHIPFFSTSQPTRLLFLTDFSLAILAALGIDYFLFSEKKIKIIFPILFVGLLFVLLWLYLLKGYSFTIPISLDNLSVAKHNLLLPTGIFVLTALLLLFYAFISIRKFHSKFFLTEIFTGIFIFITLFDVFRFSWKFNTFTNHQYLFPLTKSLSFLQGQQGQFRIMETDSRILPPNFSLIYHLQSLDGYDPLYLERYGELIAAVARNKPDIKTPFGFNRIITPTTIDSRLIDLFGVKYIVSLSDIHEPKFVKVFTEGQTQVYKNTKAFPRVFFVNSILSAKSKQEAITLLFDTTIDLHKTAIVEGLDRSNRSFTTGSAKISNYQANAVTIKTTSRGTAFFVLTDTFYPTWHVTVDGKAAKIYRTDYFFRGIIIPKGKHQVVFYDSLFLSDY